MSGVCMCMSEFVAVLFYMLQFMILHDLKWGTIQCWLSFQSDTNVSISIAS